MSENKKEKQIQGMTANLFKSEKKEHLQLSYKKVLEHLGIQSRDLFSKKDCIPMKEIDDKVIKDISKNHIKLTKAIGIVDEGNEYKRQDFVLSVIVNIVAEYYDKNVETLRGEQIDGKEIKEAIEFIIISGKYILIVIQAKKQDWDQGRALLLMQLYNAYIQNIKNGAPKEHIIYGIVTTGYTWEFIWCKGNDENNSNDIKSSITWNYEQKFDPIETSLDMKQKQWENRVAPVVKKINYMIDNTLNQLNHCDIKWA